MSGSGLMHWLAEDSATCHYGLGTVLSSRAGMKQLFALSRERWMIEGTRGNMEQELSGGRISEV